LGRRRRGLLLRGSWWCEVEVEVEAEERRRVGALLLSSLRTAAQPAVPLRSIERYHAASLETLEPSKAKGEPRKGRRTCESELASSRKMCRLFRRFDKVFEKKSIFSSIFSSLLVFDLYFSLALLFSSFLLQFSMPPSN